MSVHRLGREKKKNIENKVNALEKGVKSLKRQSTNSYRIKEIKKNKPCKNRKFTDSLDYVHCVFFKIFDCEGAKYRDTFHYMGCQAKPEWIS